MLLTKANFVSVYMLTYLYNYPMKQPSIFHKNDLERFAYDDKDSDDDYDNNNQIG